MTLYILSVAVLSFLNGKLNIIRQKQAIFVTDTSVRTKQVPLNFKRLQHTSVGGATNCQVLYQYFPKHMGPKLHNYSEQQGILWITLPLLQHPIIQECHYVMMDCYL